MFSSLFEIDASDDISPFARLGTLVADERSLAEKRREEKPDHAIDQI